MISFELTDIENETVEIVFDKEGAQNLITRIQNLLKNSENDFSNHDHLVREEWGGDELSKDKIIENSRQINHVKITYLNNSNS